MPFTHLEVHSHFTFLGGTAGPAELAARAAADGLTHLALTDTDGLYGAVAFARACKAAGLGPVIGLAASVVDAHDPVVIGPVGPEVTPGRLVLLARNPEGYRALCRLASILQGAGPGAVDGTRRNLTWDDLRVHRSGLICLSGGRLGWLDRYLRAGDLAAAQAYAGRLAGIFGEAAFLTLQLAAPGPAGADPGSGSATDFAVVRETAALARRLGLGAVAVQPVYALERSAAARLRLLSAIRCNCRLDALRQEELPGGGAVEVHWLSPQEMAARFAACPAALDAAGHIAAACGDVLPDGQPIWPAVVLAPDQTPDQALAGQTAAGLAEKYGPQAPPDVPARLARELEAIARHGFAPLFLAVAGVVRFARQNQIPVSTRGSVANSLAAYCAGITDVDPIAHDLLFERFLSPARLDPPDIDLDLCSRRRDEVLEHVRATYGAERVALVGTISTLRLASAVRETAKAYGLSETEISRLVVRLPHIHYHRISPEQADATFTEFLATVADPTEAAILHDARSIVGQPDHMSIHAGGVVITPGALTDFVPLQWTPKGFLITQYEHNDAAALGLAKIDLLGIRALTVLADAAELVRRDYDPAFRLEHIPAGDSATGDLLARADTIGVFQFESDGSRATLRKLRARTKRDLAIANAFFKPGPSTGGMATHFVRRYRGEEEATFLHPALEPILGTTRGVLLFQEQVLRIATELAGLSWGEADHLRRGMGHMQPREMTEFRDRFVAGCRRAPPAGPGLSAGQAERLWEQVAAFAGFGFNQGHATAYAAVSYRSAYIRAHWPAAFLCARLADFGGFHHPVVYMSEAIHLGIAVRPPHVNHSGEQFSLETHTEEQPGLAVGPETSGVAERRELGVNFPGGGGLWMGLGQVRDLRHAAIAAIIRQRASGPFVGVRDLLARVDLHAKELRHLVQCGALDGLAASRAALLAEAGLLVPGGAGGKTPRAGQAGHRGRNPGARQLAFAFDAPDVTSESAAQRCTWEQAVLGLPLSALVDPWALLGEDPTVERTGHAPLSLVVAKVSDRPSGSAARSYTFAGLRLPGWTGGPGFLLWDGATLVTARLPKHLKAPPPWQLLQLRGRIGGDGWGTTWLLVEELRTLS